MINLLKGLKLKSIFVFVGLGIGLIFLLSLLFSTTVQKFAIPVIIFSVALYILYNNNKSKSFKQGYLINYIMLVLMILSVGGLIYNSTIQASMGDYELIGAYEYGTISCSPALGGEKYTGAEPLNGNHWIDPIKNTVDYSIYVDYSEVEELDVAWAKYPAVAFEYYQCDNKYYMGCSEPTIVGIPTDSSKLFVVNGLDANKYTRVEFMYKEVGILDFYYGTAGIIINADGFVTDNTDNGKVNLGYEPYILWRDDSRMGGKTQMEIWTDESVDCSYPIYENNFLGAVVDSNVNELEEWNLKSYLEINEAYNYISAVSPVFTDGEALNYNGDDGYCIQEGSRATVYGFQEIETNLGHKYRVVDSSQVLGNPECCNGLDYEGLTQCVDWKFKTIEYTPIVDEDGEVIGATTDIQCSLLNPLPTARQTYDSKISFEYECVDGYAKLTNFVEEECTINSDCLDGQVCSNFKCYDIGSIPLTPEIDEEDENESMCGFFEYESEVMEKSWWFGKPKPTGEIECKIQPTYMFLGIMLSLIIIVIIGVLVNPNNPAKPKVITKTVYYKPKKVKSKPKKRK